MKRLLCAVSVIAVMTVQASAVCFAAEVPAKLTIPQDAVVGVDINVGYEDPESGDVGGADGSGANGILMVGSKGTPVLTVQNLTVQNNSTMGKIMVETVEAVGMKDANGDTWTIVSDSTDFANLPADSHKLSLMAEGTHDMTAAYEPSLEVKATEKEAISFTGKTGPVTKPYNAVQVARMVITVSVV